MKSFAWSLSLLVSASLALAQQQQQQPFQPAVPPPSMGGYGNGGFGWGGMGGVGSTAAGSSMTGMANVISAKGDYNLSTSAAAVNMTQAEKQNLENRQQYTNTYFEMRETNRQARAAEAGPRPTAEQLARMAKEYAPKPLSPSEMNTATGKLNWPDVLQSDNFAAERRQVETLLGSYSQLGTLPYSEKTKVRTVINGMAKELKGMIRKIPTTDYTTSKSFLESLMFTTCQTRLG